MPATLHTKTPPPKGWLQVRINGELVGDDHEDEPCDGCGLIYCSCDDAREEALSITYYERVPSLGACRLGHQL